VSLSWIPLSYARAPPPNCPVSETEIIRNSLIGLDKGEESFRFHEIHQTHRELEQGSSGAAPGGRESLIKV
jgi:hypothetical protein